MKHVVDAVSLIATLLGTTSMPVGKYPSADIQVEDHVEYYRIDGGTARELVAQMALLGPIGSVTGRRAAGFTASELIWEHSHEMHERVCQLNYVDVSVTL